MFSKWSFSWEKKKVFVYSYTDLYNVNWTCFSLGSPKSRLWKKDLDAGSWFGWWSQEHKWGSRKGKTKKGQKPINCINYQIIICIYIYTHTHIYIVLKGKEDCQCRILYSAIMSFKTEGKIKTYSDEQKLRELRASRPL